MNEQIIVAGFGGQGVLSLGKIFAVIGMLDGRFVTCTSSYGAEVRGGTAHSMAKISDEEIASPVIDRPTTCFVMNQPSFEKFKNRVSKGGLLFINNSLVNEDNKVTNVKVIEVPATQLAADLGNAKTANIIMLGAWLYLKPVFSKKLALQGIKEILSDKFFSLNMKALEEGFNYAKRSSS